MRGTAGALVAIGTLTFACAPVADAAFTHKPLFQLGEIPAVGPHGEPVALPGPFGRMESETIDSGHLWVAEGNYESSSRVDELATATGAFIAQPIHTAAPTEAERKLPTGYGEAYGQGIAVGHGSGEAAVYVGGESHGVSVVSVFNEAGASLGTWNGASTPGGTFGVITEGESGDHVGTVTDVAVDNSTNPLDLGRGDVFVALASLGVIDVFHPEADGEERYVGQITGVSPSEPFKDAPRMAVDEADGELFVLEQSGAGGVDVFEPTGVGSYRFVRSLTGPPPAGDFHDPYTLAVDGESGEVYVTEFPPNNEPYRIDQFSAEGVYVGQIDDIPDAFAISVDPVSHDLYVRTSVYGPDIVIPDVTTTPPMDLKPESVMLSGTVNPDGAGNATCEFEWGTSPSFGKVAPCPTEVSGSSPVTVEVPLGGLERGVTYYYRLRATNGNGTNPGEAWQDQSFTTRGVLLREESVADLSATAVTFEATINPQKQATSYYFQYGPSAAYGQQVPVPAEAIGAGTADVEVPGLHVQGLAPSTVYHYRVVVVSEVKPGELETVYGEDHTFTTQAASSSFSLLDARQWEMVSQPTKLGALIELGGVTVQASSSGNAIAYRANSPTEAESQGYAHAETVLSTRGAGGSWSSQDISPPHDQAAGSAGAGGSEFRFFSADLSQSIVVPVSGAFTPLSAEASESTTYLRSDFLGGNVEDRCGSACYRPLVTGKGGYANVPTGTVFGEEPKGACEHPTCGPDFEGASPDLSHVVLSSAAQLTQTPAPAGGPGLYEWSAGRLQLVGALPKGEEGPAVLAGGGREGAGHGSGVRHAVSDDGARVILEGGAQGGEGLYLRDVAAGETVRLDVPQGGTGPSEGMSYMTASSDASRVFFLDSGHLTASSSASGEDLYEYDLDAPAGSRLTDLTVDTNPGEPTSVAQVFGASEDGSYVYFVAAGALAEGAQAGGRNLYVRHEGVTKLVAVLSEEDVSIYGWEGGEQQFARVSPDGRWLAFMSSAELTGYDTRDAVNGHPDAEVYLYDASSDRLACASCNPTGARPVGANTESVNLSSFGFPETWVAANVPPWSVLVGAGGLQVGTFYQPRYLSDSGRLFFDSADALVPQDVNGTEDVYEYEPAGVGDCVASSLAFAPRSDGCLGLVSSGTSPMESAFVDASETGGDVFFLTQARLVSQDYDTAYDVYDAQECTSAEPCAPVAAAQPPACTTEASCKAAPAPQPALYGAPASATFSGTGNLTPTPTAQPKSKPKTKHKAKCVKRRGRRRCAKAKPARRGRRVKARALRSQQRGGLR